MQILSEHHTTSEQETLDLARALGARLNPGHGLVLAGELGAGKTVFVRGLAYGLGVDEPDEVRSPTYVLMIEHPGPKPLLHLDAYFAERSREFLEDGGDAYLRDGFVLAVEWAERLQTEIPDEFLRVEIDHDGPDRRRIRLRGDPERWSEVLEGLPAGELGR